MIAGEDLCLVRFSTVRDGDCRDEAMVVDCLVRPTLFSLLAGRLTRPSFLLTLFPLVENNPLFLLLSFCPLLRVDGVVLLLVLLVDELLRLMISFRPGL